MINVFDKYLKIIIHIIHFNAYEFLPPVLGSTRLPAARSITTESAA
jgi:hypothetical protein